MPQPTLTEAHINRPLTDLSVAYIQDPDDFIAAKVSPVVRVKRKSDAYYVFDKNDFMRDEARPRADGAETAGSGFRLSNDTYNCIVNGSHKDLGPQLQAGHDDDAIDLKESATIFVTRKILIRQEREWAESFFALGKWATDLVGTTDFTKWSDYGGSNPLADFRGARTAIRRRTGFRANKVVFGYETWETLKGHPRIQDQIKYTTDKTLTRAMFAQMLEVDEVIVAETVVATNHEGETETYDFAVGATSAWIGYVNPRPARMMPSAMYTFAWTEMPGGMDEVIQVGEEVVPLSGGAIRIEAQAAWDNKIVGADLGAFFSVAV